jgi:hypothetical protein
VLVLTALCLAATLGISAAPAQATHGCGAARSKGAKIIVKTREAVVFTKGRFEYAYGCLASVGSVYQLPNEGGGYDLSGRDGPQLAGRYVAYSTFGSAIGDEFDRVYVYDLRLGKRFLVAGSNFVSALVLKRNGSVAWVEDSSVQPGTETPVYQLRKWANEERQSVVLVDRGADLDPASLALGADRNSITWTRGGSPRSASLR